MWGMSSNAGVLRPVASALLALTLAACGQDAEPEQSAGAEAPPAAKMETLAKSSALSDRERVRSTLLARVPPTTEMPERGVGGVVSRKNDRLLTSVATRPLEFLT